MNKKIICIITGVVITSVLISVILGLTVSTLEEKENPKICGTYQSSGILDGGISKILELKTNGEFSLKKGKSSFASLNRDRLGRKTSSNIDKNEGTIRGQWMLEGNTITLSGENRFSLKGTLSRENNFDLRTSYEYFCIEDENGKRWTGPRLKD